MIVPTNEGLLDGMRKLFISTRRPPLQPIFTRSTFTADLYKKVTFTADEVE
jgi:hypothetical protein